MPQFLFPIDSNDPADFGGYLLGDYCAVQEAFNTNLEECIAIANKFTDGSWISEDREVQLRKAVQLFENHLNQRIYRTEMSIHSIITQHTTVTIPKSFHSSASLALKWSSNYVVEKLRGKKRFMITTVNTVSGTQS
jgi:hypothetical protein